MLPIRHTEVNKGVDKNNHSSFRTIETIAVTEFYEGSCIVSGIFEGKPVTGRAQFEYVP